MPIHPILYNRLYNQQIAVSSFTNDVGIVSYLGAMQAQDYGMAKWAIGLRVPGLVDSDIEAAFNKGEILRTHVLRPTWHFVSPEDIHWMIELTAPRINALSAYYYRATELDAKVFKKTNNVITKALMDNNYLTRAALQKLLEKAKIKAEGQRLSYIMMRAELDAIICSGPRQGKQFTYALIAERAPNAKSLPKQEALAALTLRYFTTRGPATLNDYTTWSGLSMQDAKEGVKLLGNKLNTEQIDDITYIFGEHQAHTQPAGKIQKTFLLPDYDEYAISYKDRTLLFGNRKSQANTKDDNPVFYHSLIVDGVAAGVWQKATNKKVVDVEITLTQKLSKLKHQAVDKAVKKYLAFVNETK